MSLGLENKVLVCAHRWKILTPTQTYYRGLTQEADRVPGISRCEWCHTNLRDGDAAPRVVMMRMEEAEVK